MQNVKQTINSHSTTVLYFMKNKEKWEKTCNRRSKKSCPLKGQCLQKGVVEKATVEQKSPKEQDTYTGKTQK